MSFSDSSMTRSEMKNVKGGTTYCGFTVYFSDKKWGVESVTTYGVCGCGNVQDCEQVYFGHVYNTFGGADANILNIKGHGCWQVGKS